MNINSCLTQIDYICVGERETERLREIERERDRKRQRYRKRERKKSDLGYLSLLQSNIIKTLYEC